MFREISGAASTLERSLIRAGSLPAASVVTAAKTRAIRGFADFEATLASTRLVRDRLADEVRGFFLSSRSHSFFAFRF